MKTMKEHKLSTQDSNLTSQGPLQSVQTYPSYRWTEGSCLMQSRDSSLFQN